VLVVKGLVLMLESNVLGLGEAVLSQGGLLRGCLLKGQPPFFFDESPSSLSFYKLLTCL
jgi:hypothetical protein